MHETGANEVLCALTGAFFAMMNILQFDVWKDPQRDEVGRFFGRWFIQLPVQKSQMLYIMTEFQPLYDWKSEHFSLWIGPEFGKAFTPGSFFRNGGALYFKPILAGFSRHHRTRHSTQ